MDTDTTTDNPLVRVSVYVRDDLLRKADEYAKRRGQSVEQILERQLYRYQDLESKKPITLDDVQRQHLEKLLGKNITTADELVSFVQRALNVQVGDIDLTLTPYLLDRLHTRCIGMEWDKFLRQIIVRALEEYCGLR